MDTQVEESSVPFSKKDRLFSSIAARMLFFVLFLADILWAFYAFARLVLMSVIYTATGFKSDWVKDRCDNAYTSLRRSLVCGVCLFIALFSPAFGILIGCTYFLTYDPAGIEEVVPASLQAQFQDFFKPGG